MESRPSAALWPAPDTGHWLYRDFHYGDRTYALVQVYGSVSTGKPIDEVRHWNAPKLAVWKLRLMKDAGLAVPIRVQLPPLPADVLPSCRRVYDAVREIVGLRWCVESGAPAPLTPEFLSEWTGLSPKAVKLARNVLRDQGIIVKVGNAGLADLWLPGRGFGC
jgi:hypothetical protein